MVQGRLWSRLLTVRHVRVFLSAAGKEKFGIITIGSSSEKNSICKAPLQHFSLDCQSAGNLLDCNRITSSGRKVPVPLKSMLGDAQSFWGSFTRLSLDHDEASAESSLPLDQSL